MNRDRRKRLGVEQADADRAQIALSDLLTNLEEIRDEEQEALDNMPEGLQGSEAGEIAQAAIDQIEEAIDAIQTYLDAEVPDAIGGAAE